MKTILLALCLLCTPALAEDAIARSGKDTVRITDDPCPQQVLKLLPEGTRGYFRAAFSVVDDKSYAGCWALRNDRMVLLVYPDGDQGLLPAEDFELAPGV